MPNHYPIATGIVGVLVASQVMYATLWKPSGIAPAIESATSVTSGAPTSTPTQASHG